MSFLEDAVKTAQQQAQSKERTNPLRVGICLGFERLGAYIESSERRVASIRTRRLARCGAINTAPWGLILRYIETGTRLLFMSGT